MRVGMIIKITFGGQTCDVRYSGGTIDSPIDLDWVGIETKGPRPIAKWGISSKS